MFDSYAMVLAARSVLVDHVSSCFTSVEQDERIRRSIESLESSRQADIVALVAFHLGRIQESANVNLFTVYRYMDQNGGIYQHDFIRLILLLSICKTYNEVNQFQSRLRSCVEETHGKWTGFTTFYVQDVDWINWYRERVPS